MTDETPLPPASGAGVEPAPAAAPPSRRWLSPVLLLGILAAVVVVGGGTFLFARTAVRSALAPQGDAHAAMVPASVDGYVAIAIDPSVQQKLNLLTVAHKFPKTKTDADIEAQVEKTVDAGLKNTGLTYLHDIKPWLGRQVSFAFTVNASNAGKSDYAMLALSKDDSAANAALGKLRTSGDGAKAHWTKRSHLGVDVWTADIPRPARASGEGGPGHVEAAFVHGSVVLASSPAMMDAIIDSDQGKVARLADSAPYKSAMAKVQADHLVAAYVNAHSLATKARDAFSRSGTPLAGSSAQTLQALDAYTEGAFSLAARPDGLETDAWVGIDAAKLPAALRGAYSSAPHANPLVKLLPPQAFMAAGGTGLKAAVKQLANSAASAPSSPGAGLSLQALTGASGPLAHLGDDAAIELDKGSADRYFGGAVVLETDDAAATTTFLREMLAFGELAGSGSLAPGARPASPTRETYRGATIESITVAGAGAMGVQPAFAVNNGVVVIASSPAHVREILDQQASSGGGISADPLFDAAVPSGTDGGFLYLDVPRATTAFRTVMSPSQKAAYDKDTAPDLAPLRAFSVIAQNHPDGTTEKLVLLVQ